MLFRRECPIDKRRHTVVESLRDAAEADADRSTTALRNGRDDGFVRDVRTTLNPTQLALFIDVLNALSTTI